jgi:Arc/MetJ family transcription regulator
MLCLSDARFRRSMRLMRKHTTLDLDEDLMREAAAALGTHRTTDTVHAALAEVVARRRRARLAGHDFPDLTPDTLEAMRAPRRFGLPGGAPASGGDPAP